MDDRDVGEPVAGIAPEQVGDEAPIAGAAVIGGLRRISDAREEVQRQQLMGGVGAVDPVELQPPLARRPRHQRKGRCAEATGHRQQGLCLREAEWVPDWAQRLKHLSRLGSSQDGGSSTDDVEEDVVGARGGVYVAEAEGSPEQRVGTVLRGSRGACPVGWGALDVHELAGQPGAGDPG